MKERKETSRLPPASGRRKNQVRHACAVVPGVYVGGLDEAKLILERDLAEIDDVRCGNFWGSAPPVWPPGDLGGDELPLRSPVVDGDGRVLIHVLRPNVE
jgi:hypothetical protein